MLGLPRETSARPDSGGAVQRYPALEGLAQRAQPDRAGTRITEMFQPKLEDLLVDERDVVETADQAVHKPPLEKNLAWLQFRLEHNRGSQDTTRLLNRFAAQLETWSLNFVDASTLEDVFRD